MQTPKLTTRQRRMTDELRDLWLTMLFDTRHPVLLEGKMPPEWAEILEGPEPAQVRVTLRIDADVAKWFRSFGPRYQKSVARVLRGFMLYRLSELADVVEGPPAPMKQGDVLQGHEEQQLVRELHKLRKERRSWLVKGKPPE
ncbi:BrnA antitoxin family protein [Pseudoroseicyclus tamaricis]|uniref:BrnA antitoxin family protein n=1 Tax=Pseudoroseicyclus tamaricis TaxID=2705421 RepID=A0A6B2JZI6_9RHOB|nr:BrnA antitoxin family protein [Pseudoroseicyclus tamaricis]NDU99535.1 BrnA antitoxin family protein [Pseudoroseicyclus tamaricis]